jgi:cytosine/adenosine deaminase-related metal-dependent hydrolase
MRLISTLRHAARNSLLSLAAVAGLVAMPVVAAEDEGAAGKATKYDWYLQATTPAGQSVITRSGDGRLTNETFVHWNNREYTVNSETQLDADGFIVRQRITGISPFKAPIDENFSIADGKAAWSTVGENGSATVDSPAFYVNSEMGAIESIGALINVALSRIDGEVPLLPSGSARVEHVRDVEVAVGDGERIASLYAISGISFTPVHAWLDEQGDLLALDFGGYLGMVPEGWSKEALTQLSAVQTEEIAAHNRSITADLTHRLDAPLVVENVDVLDVASGELKRAHFVVVDKGKIAAISKSAPEIDGAIRIDGRGKTLMPGLWDMHGHFGLADGVLNIAGGITSVRSIGSVHEKIMDIVEQIDSGAVIGPRTYRAGFMDKAGQYASGWTAETLEDALERVDFYAEHGYLQVKLYSSIEPEWVKPIAERAHSHGMRLSGHIPAFMSAEQAIRAGYDEIQHINMVFLNFISGDQADTRQQLRFSLYGEKGADVDLDSQEVDEFIELLVEKDIVIDPTAAIFEDMLTHVAGEPSPTFASVISHLPPTVGRGMFNPQFPNGDTWSRSAPNQAKMLRKLYEGGVTLVPGSDNLAAFTVHRELEVYVNAGIPNAAVLRMATLDSAAVVGVDERTGSIEVGKDADLILIDGNPLDDISAVRRATLVIKGDTAYRPDQLYKAVGVTPFVPSSEI